MTARLEQERGLAHGRTHRGVTQQVSPVSGLAVNAMTKGAAPPSRKVRTMNGVWRKMAMARSSPVRKSSWIEARYDCSVTVMPLTMRK